MMSGDSHVDSHFPQAEVRVRDAELSPLKELWCEHCTKEIVRTQ